MDNNQRGREMDKTYQPHQQRVIDESTELKVKIAGLAAFIESDRFVPLDHAERMRMRGQLAAMQVYAGYLSARIAAF
jgi:hypothetical protein